MEPIGALAFLGEFVYHLVAASAFSALGGLFLLTASAAVRDKEYKDAGFFAVFAVTSSGIGWVPFWGESLQGMSLRPVVQVVAVLSWLFPLGWVLFYWGKERLSALRGWVGNRS